MSTANNQKENVSISATNVVTTLTGARVNETFDINITNNQPEEVIILDLSKDIPINCKTLNISLEENTQTIIVILHNSTPEKLTHIKTKINLMKNSKLIVIDVIISNTGLTTKTLLCVDQQILLSGEGACAKSTVVFLGSTNDIIDIKTTMQHEADQTLGNMLCRGALLENSSVKFFAKVSVPKGIRNIESHQNMKCLTQGDKSVCQALPVLDVHSDSVSCSHGVAIGRVEEESIFYLQSRGINKSDAQAMILQGLLMQELEQLNQINQISKDTYQKISESIKEKLGLNSK